MPGSTPATNQLDWLSSTTAMIVLSWSKVARDLLKACPGEGRGRSVGASGHSVSYLPATMVPFSSPPAPYHLSAGGGSHERTRLGNDRFWTVGVRMAVERPVNYLLKEKTGSTMLELKTFLDSSRLGAALFAGRINS